MTTQVYSAPLIDAARAIRELYPVCSYDPALYYAPGVPIDPVHVEQRGLYARGYGAFKYAVAKVLQPRRIVEVGVGYGTAAHAFLWACPQAKYTGVDNSVGRPGVLDLAKATLRGFDATILEADSQGLTALPQADLIHVDGCHEYDACYHDTAMALRAAEWVLVDDARDSVVAAAALKAAMDWRWGELDWCVFEDTWTGSILFHTTKNIRSEHAGCNDATSKHPAG